MEILGEPPAILSVGESHLLYFNSPFVCRMSTVLLAVLKAVLKVGKKCLDASAQASPSGLAGVSPTF